MFLFCGVCPPEFTLCGAIKANIRHRNAEPTGLTVEGDVKRKIQCCVLFVVTGTVYHYSPPPPQPLSASEAGREGAGARTRGELRVLLTSRSVESDEKGSAFKEGTGQSPRRGGGPYANVLARETQRFIHLLPEGEVSEREGYFTLGTSCCGAETETS